MSRQSRQLTALAAATLLGGVTLVFPACGRDPRPSPATTSGGDLLVTVRSEPQSFNFLTKRDSTTQLVSLLTQARLFRINGATQELEPWLVENATTSPDGLRHTLTLRPNLTFSDGTPVTAADVVFSLAAAYDRGSVIGDALLAGGKPLTAAAIDDRVVEIRFPAPFGPGLRLLDSLPILPRHRLEPALKAGTFASTWTTSTAVSEIVGLGPFVLGEYVPGQRLVFNRNPRYFRRDGANAPLPHLDRVIVDIVPDQDAQMLRLQSGQSDMPSQHVRPEDYAALKRAADAGQLQLVDLGMTLDPDGLWFNLKPGAFAGDPRASWIQRDELRQAISLAVDRQLFADTVFLGAAEPVFGPITPANKRWYSDQVPHTPHDPQRAKALLGSIGLEDRNHDGLLEDSRGTVARLTLLAPRGKSALERGASVIADELKKVGLTVDVAALEGNAVVERFLAGKGYDAIYFSLITSDTDPALSADFWLSSGNAHVWNLDQKSPATDWERRIDELMNRQSTSLDTAERQRLFTEVQKIFAEHLPIVHFAAPRMFVAASSRVTGLTPAVSTPPLLWAADSIAIRR